MGPIYRDFACAFMIQRHNAKKDRRIRYDIITDIDVKNIGAYFVQIENIYRLSEFSVKEYSGSYREGHQGFRICNAI